MNLHPEEISGIIKSQIKHYKDKIDQAEVGTVVMVGDGIAKAYGLENCMSNELLAVSYTHLTLPTNSRV